jgi:hypothetical protein
MLLFTLPVVLWAQSNELIDDYLDQEQAPYGQSVYLVLSAAGMIEVDADVETALETLQMQNWGIPARNPQDPTTLGDLSYLIMRAFNMSGGIMYSIAPGPRYAARELHYKRLVSGSSAADRELSGEDAVRILGRVLERQGGGS